MTAARGLHRRVLECGERAVIIECADTAEALGLGRTLGLPGPQNELVAEVVPGAQTVLVRFHRRPTGRELAAVADLQTSPPDDHAGVSVQIEVDYTGEDLGEVADQLEITTEEVITRHTGQTWTVAFCGFAPGFGYLYGEHDSLRVPRRRSPRVRVPAGAVGLADRWSGVYPREGPGGWQLIGRTRTPMWDLERDPPALLRPGTSVRFVAT